MSKTTKLEIYQVRRRQLYLGSEPSMWFTCTISSVTPVKRIVTLGIELCHTPSSSKSISISL